MKKLILSILTIACSISLPAQDPYFKADVSPKENPWSKAGFKNDPMNFQFVIVTDRTGGHRDGVFEKGIGRVNLLQPEFVMSVGDMIEGYTKDLNQIDIEWKEFNSYIDTLQMRYFYVPGNHDISNEVMREEWLKRYGRPYFHFVYKDVLFLCMDTNDGDGVMMSKDQVEYIKKAIAENTNVRWTLLFMHHPVWNYKEYNGFSDIEAALKGRKYTVYAGHNHRYLQAIRNEANYYILGTTGGGSALRGPRFGEYDHVVWMTMTDKGPVMLNLTLEGMLDPSISNEKTAAMARGLINATTFNHLILKKRTGENGFEGAKALIHFSNTADQPLYLKSHFYHHHHVSPSLSKLDLELPAGGSRQLEIDLTPLAQSLPDSMIDPLELDWVMGFKTDKLDTPFDLKGTMNMALDQPSNSLKFSENAKFMDTLTAFLNHSIENVELRFTVDGSIPTFQSPRYEKGVLLNKTTLIKARFFSKDGLYLSDVFEKTYVKEVPRPALTIKKKEAGLKYSYYEGNFTQLPDFNKLTALKTGVAKDFNIEALAAPRTDHYAVTYDGLLEIPQDGIITFYTYSDDGSKLYIDNELVVNNDGSHDATLKRGQIALKAGLHSIRIEYFEDFLGQELRVGYEGAGLTRGEIPFEKFWWVKK